MFRKIYSRFIDKIVERVKKEVKEDFANELNTFTRKTHSESKVKAYGEMTLKDIK